MGEGKMKQEKGVDGRAMTRSEMEAIIARSLDDHVHNREARRIELKKKFEDMSDDKFRDYVLPIAKEFHDNPYEKEKNKFIDEMKDIMDYIDMFGTAGIPDPKCMFSQYAYELRGFRNETTCGQGCFSRLYYNKEAICQTFC